MHKQLESSTTEADRATRIRVLERIATIYEKMEDHAEAIDRYLQILTIAEELHDHKRIYAVAIKLGRLHLLHRLYPRACSYYLLAEQHAPSRVKALLARLHAANVLLFNGDFEEAESLIISVHSEKHADKAKAVRLRATQLMAILRNNQKSYSESLQLHEKCIEMLGNKDMERQMDIRKSMALALYYMGKREEAIEKLNEIPQDLLEQSSKRLKKLVYEIYTACYAELGNFEKAFHYQGHFKDLDHSITQDKVSNKLTAIQVNNKLIQVQYERETFLKRSEELAQKNAVIDRERKKSDDLLLNILPEQVANELKERGKVEAKYHEEVTVLFTDFKGFTAMAELLSAKELVEDLNICFSEFDRIMEKHGIEKIKTIGDAYMAAGGLPTPNATHATDVVKAAMEMRDFVASGKARKIEQGLPFFEVRVGIHTGPVVAGIVGIKKFAYDIWGDTVNTASRMESSGEVGKVNISETTYQLVKNQFTCEYRGEIEAKGKGKVKMYFVENA